MNISQMQVHISSMLWVIHQLHPMFALFGLAGWQDPPMRSGQHLANCLLALSRLSLCNEQHGKPSKKPIGRDFFMCKFDMATSFYQAGIPPSGGDSKGTPPKMHLIQSLGRM